MSQRIQRHTALALMALASGLVGCSAFQEKLRPQLNSEVSAAGGPVVEPAAKYTVEIRPHQGKPQAVEKDLTEPLHVQAALEKTGALRKFRRMDLELFRPLPSGGWHKVKLEFDRGQHEVPPEYDYALLPGDRVIVTEDPRTIVDDAFESVLRPLGIDSPIRRPKASDKYEIRG